MDATTFRPIENCHMIVRTKKIGYLLLPEKSELRVVSILSFQDSNQLEKLQKNDR